MTSRSGDKKKYKLDDSSGATGTSPAVEFVAERTENLFLPCQPALSLRVGSSAVCQNDNDGEMRLMCVYRLHEGSMLVVDSFASSTECTELISTCERMPMTAPAAASLPRNRRSKNHGRGNQRHVAADPHKVEPMARGFTDCFQAESSGFAYRCNGRIQMDDAALAATIFQRLLPLLPVELPPSSRKMAAAVKPVGCSSNIRFYRYTTGQRFGKHIDESNFDEKLGGWSCFTVLIYLNGSSDADDREETLFGGETVFYSQPTGGATQGRSSSKSKRGKIDAGDVDETVFVAVRPRRGRLLIHLHGNNNCLTHEAKEVQQGVKYVLRTDVIYA